MDQRGVWDSIAGEWSRYRKKPFAEVKEIASGMTGLILDLGCGSGRNFLPDKKIVALDFSESMLRLAAKKQYCIFVQGDMPSLPFKAETFDNIIAVAVLHCTSEWKHAVSESCRVLKKGGKMLVTVWDGEQKSFKGMPKEMIKKWGIHDRYYYLFSQKELEQELANAGFSIVKFGRFANKFSEKQADKHKFWNLLVLAEKRP